MSPRTTKAHALLKLARRGPFRARALEAVGIPRAYLARLVERGELERIGRGVYRVPDVDRDENELADMALSLVRVPQATLCLLTAARLHGLVRRAPEAIWLMIGTHDRRPHLVTPRVACVRAHTRVMNYGVERHTCRFGVLRVTSSAKTVADCFRYRHRIGLDTAVGVLKAFLRDVRGGAEGATLKGLVRAASIDRVLTVILPHLPGRTRQAVEALRGARARE